jgi:hypothetical protein
VFGIAVLIFGGGWKVFVGPLATGIVSTSVLREIELLEHPQDPFEPSVITSERSRKFETELEGDFGGDLSRAIFSEMDGETAGNSC